MGQFLFASVSRALRAGWGLSAIALWACSADAKLDGSAPGPDLGGQVGFPDQGGGDEDLSTGTCADGVRNQTESDIDCGGTCGECEDGRQCARDADCRSMVCMDGTCRVPGCDDQRKDGLETDVDCGGGTCRGCAVGRACMASRDCLSRTCTNGSCTACQLAFAPKVDYPVGGEPFSVDIGDVNGDGRPDLVAPNSWDAINKVQGRSVSILLNKGGAVFGSPQVLDSGQFPYEATVVDLNGDGMRDIAVLNYGGWSVAALLNQGGGVFAAKVEYKVGQEPNSMAVGDLSGDGKPDAVAVSQQSVSVLINKGGGTFQDKVDYPPGSSPNAVGLGDLNGDGKLDIVTANLNNTISVLINKGGGTFAPKVDYATEFPTGVVVADFDGDAKADVVTVSTHTITLLLNKGGGVLSTRVDFPVERAANLASADLDGDGRLDLACSSATNVVAVLLNLGGGQFGPSTTYPTGQRPYRLAIADVDGDGRPDLAVPNRTDQTVSVLLNRCK